MNLQNLHYWKKAFESYAQENGKLNLSQFEALIRSLGYNPTSTEIEDMKNDLKDIPEIDFNSFSYILYRHSRYSKPEEELERSFSFFDKENKGTLPCSDVKKILKNIKHPFNDEQIDKIIDKIGQNDNEIEIKSLVRILLNL